MNKPEIKIRKKPDVKPPPTVDDNQKRHELGLLRILVQKYPDKAKEIVQNAQLQTV